MYHHDWKMKWFPMQTWYLQPKKIKQRLSKMTLNSHLQGWACDLCIRTSNGTIKSSCAKRAIFSDIKRSYLLPVVKDVRKSNRTAIYVWKARQIFSPTSKLDSSPNLRGATHIILPLQIILLVLFFCSTLLQTVSKNLIFIAAGPRIDESFPA